MKKWLLLFIATYLLTACNEEQTTVRVVANVNDDVAIVVAKTDPSKFASFIYNEQGESYLILNTQGTATVTFKQVHNEGQFHITHEKNVDAEFQPIVFSISLKEQFDFIRIFENEQEIAFDVWTE